MRILLAEDSEPLRDLFSRLLRGDGFEVRAAADGRAALDCLEDFEPDLVLTDLMMPALDGLGLLRQLRSMPGTAAVPVVVMSAGATPEAEREARSAGAAEFLTKPVDSAMLRDCIGGYCRG